MGRLAAHVVQEFMQDWLTRRWAEVKENPAEAFRTLFREVRATLRWLFFGGVCFGGVVWWWSFLSLHCCFFSTADTSCECGGLVSFRSDQRQGVRSLVF